MSWEHDKEGRSIKDELRRGRISQGQADRRLKELGGDAPGMVKKEYGRRDDEYRNLVEGEKKPSDWRG